MRWGMMGMLLCLGLRCGAQTADTASAAERLYEVQTSYGSMVREDKGPAVFFPMKGGAEKEFYYGFYNGAARGTLVRVTNPDNGRSVLVKVLGPVPGNKLYYQALIGISARAKSALGTTSEKLWCRLAYGTP